MSAVGRAIRRVGDPPLLRGQARFVADLAYPGMLEAVIVRSPHAHADLGAVDLRAARAAPGVAAVITAADLPEPLPVIPMRLSPEERLEAACQPVLADQRVRYVGEPVAVVVADNRYRAEDAAELVQIAWHPRPAAVDTVQSASDSAPRLHEALPSNAVFHLGYRRMTVPRATQLAVTLDVRVQRHTGMPLETRGLLAVPEDGRLHVYGPTKVVHFNHAVLARLLGMDPAQIHCVEPAVGGGFGIRGEFYPEDFLIPFLALRLNRPVRWIEDRLEHFHAANHSREQTHRVTVGVGADGRLETLVDRIWVDTGSYVRTHGVTVPELTQAMLPGPYRWSGLDISTAVVVTNKTPAGTYRGPGRFEGTFVRERAVDSLARSLGRDPVAMRRVSLLRPEDFPYATGGRGLGEPIVYDSGDYPYALDEACRALDWEGFPARRRRAAETGRLRGHGLAMFVEKSGLGPWEEAWVALERDGRITCRTGLADLGQGMETALAQLVAGALDVDPFRVRVVHGDTDAVPRGHGSFASRGTATGGVAAFEAASALADRIREVVGGWLEAAPGDVELSDRGVAVRGVPAKAWSWTEVAGRAQDMGIRLACARRFVPEGMVYPYGVHAAEVEVDPDSGALSIVRYVVVYDVGRAVNPALVAGQIRGGMAQGLGGALYEQLAYDSHGQLVTASFMDYLIPGATEVPDVDVILLERTPSPRNPLGVKGAGEGGAVGVAPALANAVADALDAPPEAFTALPITPEVIWRTLRTRAGG
jgi:carbon-monoxide dehydrogenase large subunit